MKPQQHLESVIEGHFDERASEGLEKFYNDNKSSISAVQLKARKRKSKWDPQKLAIAARRQIRLDRLEVKRALKLPPAGWIKYKDLAKTLGFTRATAYNWRMAGVAMPERFKGNKWWISPEEASRLVEWLRSVDSPTGGFYVKRSSIIVRPSTLKADDIKAGEDWLATLLAPRK